MLNQGRGEKTKTTAYTFSFRLGFPRNGHCQFHNPGSTTTQCNKEIPHKATQDQFFTLLCCKEPQEEKTLFWLETRKESPPFPSPGSSKTNWLLTPAGCSCFLAVSQGSAHESPDLQVKGYGKAGAGAPCTGPAHLFCRDKANPCQPICKTGTRNHPVLVKPGRKQNVFLCLNGLKRPRSDSSSVARQSNSLPRALRCF